MIKTLNGKLSNLFLCHFNYSIYFNYNIISLSINLSWNIYLGHFFNLNVQIFNMMFVINMHFNTCACIPPTQQKSYLYIFKILKLNYIIKYVLLI